VAWTEPALLLQREIDGICRNDSRSSAECLQKSSRLYDERLKIAEFYCYVHCGISGATGQDTPSNTDIEFEWIDRLFIFLA